MTNDLRTIHRTIVLVRNPTGASIALTPRADGQALSYIVFNPYSGDSYPCTRAEAAFQLRGMREAGR